MGCIGTRNKTNHVVKSKKFNNKLNFTQINKENDSDINQIKKVIRRNMFNAIQKKTWLIILDFLHYRDLNKVGKLNKYFYFLF